MPWSHNNPDSSWRQGAEESEAIAILRRIMEKFPTDNDVTTDCEDCVFCGGQYKSYNHIEHMNDCPWVATRDFLASLES